MFARLHHTSHDLRVSSCFSPDPIQKTTNYVFPDSDPEQKLFHFVQRNTRRRRHERHVNPCETSLRLKQMSSVTDPHQLTTDLTHLSPCRTRSLTYRHSNRYLGGSFRLTVILRPVFTENQDQINLLRGLGPKRAAGHLSDARRVWKWLLSHRAGF